MVVAWILNALSKDIAGSVVYIDLAYDMWKDLCTRFEQTNLAQKFAIYKELCTIAQGNG